jgi:hypothetical protein
MKKKITIGALIALLFWIGLTVSLLASREARAVIVQLNVRGLSEHGVELIPPTDPSFEASFADLLNSKPNPIANALRPYSVVVENKGGKTVVGYRLKWEAIGPDGRVVVREAGGVMSGLLMSQKRSESASSSFSGGYVINAGSKTLVSPAGTLGELDSGTIGGYAVGSSEHADIDRLRELVAQKGASSLPDLVLEDLRKLSAITVSIDGIFFEDGTFVGPDTTGFFEDIEADISAKRDLFEEIAFVVARNQSLDRLFSDIEQIAKTPIPDRKLNRADVYVISKRMHAQGLLRMRAAMGGEKAVAISLHELRQPWPKLRKL